MNIAISRAFGVLRLVGARGEMEKEEILKKVENQTTCSDRDFGTRRIERRGKLLRTTGPRSPQYLERSHRGGWLASRWNLILPDSLKPSGGAGEH